jgi:hypothetical protein
MTNDKQTAEEAARGYCDQYSWNDPREEDAEAAFLAGVRWAQEREKVLWTGWAMINNDGTITQDSPILDTEPWKTGKYVRVNIVEVPE